MCLSVPARVLEIDPARPLAKVDYLGSRLIVGTALLEDVRPGQYVLVHIGEAIQIIDEKSAQESIELWKGWLDQE